MPSAFVYPAENILQNQDTSNANSTNVNSPSAPVNASSTATTNTLNSNGNVTTSGNILSYNNITAQQQQQQTQMSPTVNNLTMDSNPNNLQSCPSQLPCEISSQDDLRYHGTELVMLYDYKAQAPDDLSARRGEIIYADLNNQTVEGWLWAYAPKAKKCGRYGFIPKSYTHTYNRQNTSV